MLADARRDRSIRRSRRGPSMVIDPSVPAEA
jgi:hypothetical protein